jgi:hypothetical protein
MWAASAGHPQQQVTDRLSKAIAAAAAAAAARRASGLQVLLCCQRHQLGLPWSGTHAAVQKNYLSASCARCTVGRLAPDVLLGVLRLMYCHLTAILQSMYALLFK